MDRLEGLDYRERTGVLKRLASLLENMEEQGVLRRRHEVQSIGYGDEIGFDYVRSTRTKAHSTTPDVARS